MNVIKIVTKMKKKLYWKNYTMKKMNNKKYCCVNKIEIYNYEKEKYCFNHHYCMVTMFHGRILFLRLTERKGQVL